MQQSVVGEWKKKKQTPYIMITPSRFSMLDLEPKLKISDLSLELALVSDKGIEFTILDIRMSVRKLICWSVKYS